MLPERPVWNRGREDVLRERGGMLWWRGGILQGRVDMLRGRGDLLREGEHMLRTSDNILDLYGDANVMRMAGYAEKRQGVRRQGLALALALAWTRPAHPD